ncbi:MAG: nucleoside-diphosphate sugar epimerase/dehydratase [Thermoanaerobaculia bacterium]
MTGARAKSPEAPGRAFPAGTKRRWGLLARRVQLLLDVGVLAAAFAAAYLLRFEFLLGPVERQLMLWQLPAVVLLQLLSQRVWGIYRFIWRYIGLSEIRAFIGAALTSFAVMIVCRFGLPRGATPDLRVSISVTLIDVGLAFAGTLGIRVLRRMLFESGERESEERAREHEKGNLKVLLVGAGKAGVLASREMQGGAMPHLDVKGFVDDDLEKLGSVVNGVRVLGTSAEIPRLAEELAIDEIIITVARASRSQIRRIVSLCEKTPAKVRIIPGFYEILGGKVDVKKIRNVEIEDLLGRESVKLDEHGLHEFLSGKTVMVTGAGGSIGSELVRQVVPFSPLCVLLVERSEYALFQIEQEARRAWPTLNFVPVLADVGDAARMREVFEEYRPELVIHAAAHKHVPLVESNPGEAVKNNVVGTLTTGELAGEFGAGAFILISTDKAVNPTSVMGATKRAAELVIQMLDQRFDTAFLAVRFGNVLGSTGSVVPTFREQIARGGPVTVTHPEMRRYFMTIPEAAQLVLQAGSMGAGGEIFILDMGQPVKVVDIARDMIHLSGLTPGEDIEIVFTGLRPGEKLFEELGTSADDVDRTRHEKVFVGKIPQLPSATVIAAVSRMAAVVRDGDGKAVRAELQKLIPEAILSDEARAADGRRQRKSSRLRVVPTG